MRFFYYNKIQSSAYDIIISTECIMMVKSKTSVKLD